MQQHHKLYCLYGRYTFVIKCTVHVTLHFIYMLSVIAIK